MDIILYLLNIIQYLYQMNCWLLNFICGYIPLKQWAFDDSHSPKYQKFKIDQLPLVTDFRQDWTYKELIPYYEKRYGKKIGPVRRRCECDIPEDCSCPRCDAPMPYLWIQRPDPLQGMRCQILPWGQPVLFHEAALPALRQRPCPKERAEALHPPQMCQSEMLLLPPQPQKGG